MRVEKKDQDEGEKILSTFQSIIILHVCHVLLRTVATWTVYVRVQYSMKVHEIYYLLSNNYNSSGLLTLLHARDGIYTVPPTTTQLVNVFNLR